MKVSYVNSICVSHDAISEAARNEITWIRERPNNEIKLYCYECDFGYLPFKQVNDVAEIAFDRHFQTSDLVVFHFGIYSPLFDLLPLVPKNAKRVVIFHNVTPKQFIAAQHHEMIDKSFRQISNILFADFVACDSQTNLDVLRASGIETPAKVLSLAIGDDLHAPRSKPSHNDGIIRVAFVGRFVRSKGPTELLQAVDMELARNTTLQLSLTMIGNVAFSDAELLAEIRSTINTMNRIYGGRLTITLCGDATEETKHHVLRDADLFALPTYHEGFCVPVIEALASGCKVIAYDNSNTPAISGGFAKLSTTGDIAALSRNIGEAIEEISSNSWRGTGPDSYVEYVDQINPYVAKFSTRETKKRFLQFVDDIMCNQYNSDGGGISIEHAPT